MKRLILLISIITVLSIDGYTQSATTKKNYFMIGMDVGISDFDDNSILDVNFNAGYEINFRNLPFLTIDPIIGAGFIKKKEETPYDYVLLSRYNISFFTFGVAPKLQISNPDRDFFVYLENEFSFWNGFAKIEDEGYDQIRKNQQYFNFYYSPKIGCALALNNAKLSIWVGLSTLNVTKIINHNRHAGQEKYGDQPIPFRAGLKILF